MPVRKKWQVLGIVALTLATVAPAAGAGAPAEAQRIEGQGFEMTAALEFPYASEVATTEVNGRSLAVATTSGDRHGSVLHVVDVTRPERPRRLGRIGCAGGFGDPVATSDQGRIAMLVYGGEQACFGVDGFGLAVVDVSDPRRPKVTGAAEVETLEKVNPRSLGSIAFPALTANPAQPFVYVTVVGDQSGTLSAWSIDSGEPEMTSETPLPFHPRDLDVHEDGKLLAVALENGGFAGFDLSDAANPAPAWAGQCPGCSYTTEVAFAGRFTLVVQDETLNPLGCPAGTLYFYSVEQGVPALIAAHSPSKVEPDPDGSGFPRGCWARDLEASEDGNFLLVNWHRNSLRLLDIRRALGAGLNEPNASRVHELAWVRPKLGQIDGATFVGNDHVVTAEQLFGLRVLRVEPSS